jgi:hypothetical protein
MIEGGWVDGRTLKPVSIWTVDRVERLRKLWAEEFTATEIAKEMGLVSRCAVLGKAHRLGLKPRVERANGSGKKRCTDPVVLEARKRNHAHAQRIRKAAARGLPPPPEPEIVVEVVAAYEGSLNLPFGELRMRSSDRINQCRFPEGTGPAFHYCGTDTPAGSSWCAHHHKIVHGLPEGRTFKVVASRRGLGATNFSRSTEAA